MATRNTTPKARTESAAVTPSIPPRQPQIHEAVRLANDARGQLLAAIEDAEEFSDLKRSIPFRYIAELKVPFADAALDPMPRTLRRVVRNIGEVRT